jgi:hypothetical protein
MNDLFWLVNNQINHDIVEVDVECRTNHRYIRRFRYGMSYNHITAP